MSATPWILIMILGIAIITVVIAILFAKYRKEKTPVDYYVLFIMGICLFPLGMTLSNPFFFIMGLVFMGVGLANKDKWKDNHRSWDKMGPEQKRMKHALLIGIGVLILAVLIYFLLRHRYLL
ncbi:MAG: hypothetical protein KKE20_02900 [Nanoarchaeota archaeon]|nr:hypothetical protein [Nanoarchaeota archaeon]